LRDYGAATQIGLEGTPDEYVATMVAVFREVWRVMRDDGTLWLNLGDCYQDKNLIGIPWRVAFALQVDGWYLRSDIIWAKPNPMPESVTDRPTKSHEYVFLLSKSARYYYDADVIATPPAEASVARLSQRNLHNQRGSYRCPGKTNGPMRAVLGGRNKHAGYENRMMSGREDDGRYLERGVNMRDVLTLSTASFKGAHFAVMPERLAAICVLAGCPEGGTVLDPFCGSGTTGVVAAKYGRRFVGVDVSAEFCRMAFKRVAPHYSQGGLLAPCGSAPGKVGAR
jgi:site-specific DNA-methyltransferase (adenine-specific)